MSQVSNNYKANYANALGTAVFGGAAWGAGQYVFCKRPFMDDNKNIKDSFVKKMEDALVEIKDKTTIDNVEYQKSLETKIDTFKNVEELKNFITSKKEELLNITDDDIKTLNEEIGKMEFDEGKNFTKGLFKSEGKYGKHFHDTLESCYDDAGKLVHDEAKLPKEKFDVLKKVIKKERAGMAIVSALTFTAFCAAGCCLFEYFLARKSKKANQRI